MKKILFLCTHNSARSIMAEALFNHYFSEVAEAKSAGTDPTGVNPLTLKVLEEIGIDTKNLRSKSVQEMLNEDFDLVITVCDNAKESCPVFPKPLRKIHQSFEDPAASNDIEVFRRVRDEILRWMKNSLILEV
ncbi:MAG: arsenate reductase ArsC [Actinobacteria bacterium]|nr:arsenate reductase ArsC [Actinomycetota bacterium]